MLNSEGHQPVAPMVAQALSHSASSVSRFWQVTHHGNLSFG